jgi:glycosidase
MDWVANHTAWDNPWIENDGWYTTDSGGNIIHPPGTNWLDVADLNYANSDMRAAMIDAMRFWVDSAGVDGFRCDYADGVPFDFWSEAIDSLNQSAPTSDLIMLAEGTRDDHFTAGFDLNFGFNFYYALIDVYEGASAVRLIQSHNTEYANVPEGKHFLRYTTNHDGSAWEATPIALYRGKHGALSASVATLFLGGVPMIYTGQEVGTETNVPFFSNSTIHWDDNRDMLETYHFLMEIYANSEAAKNGDLTYYNYTNVVCFTRKTESEEILVMVNVRETSSAFTLPLPLRSTEWENVLTGEEVMLEISRELHGYEYQILRVSNTGTWISTD